MTLKHRVVIFVTTLFVVLTAMLFLSFDYVVMSRFQELETEAANRNLLRVSQGFQSLQDEIKSKSEEWGSWDDSYSYLQEQNSAYEKSNLTFEALSQLGYRHFLMTDNDLATVKSIGVNDEDESVNSLSPETEGLLRHVAEQVRESGIPTSTIVQIEGVSFLVGAAPVTNSAADVPPIGVLVFSKDFSAEEIARLKSLTKTDLTITPVASLDSNDELFSFYNESATALQPTTIIGSEAGFIIDTIKDVFNKPALFIRIKMSRELFHRGQQARNMIAIYTMLFTVIALVFSLIFFNKYVIFPLRRMGSQIVEIGERHNEDLRIDEFSDREISTLAREINRMLEQLSESKSEVGKARDMAEAANQAKSSFIAKVSHELRTPIHSIMGMQRIILKESKSNSIKHFVRLAQESSKGLMSTINEILDFSKVESGNLTLEKIPFDIRGVARETMRLMSGRLEAKPDLQLLCDVHPDVPVQLEGDPTRIRQIMVNLLGNSIKFTAHGSVKLTVRNSKPADNWDGIILAISDTGIGIPEEKLSSIFEPFKQADDSVTRNYQGTGLGLTIVKQLCEGMNGSVSVESTLGKGSVFTAHLGIPMVSETIYELPITVQPRRLAIIGGGPAWLATLTSSLERLSVTSTLLKQEESGEVLGVDAALGDCGAVVVSSEVLEDGENADVILKQAAARNLPLVAVLKPSEISLRERLISSGVKFILTQPLFTDDIFLALSGKLPLDDQSWEDTDEASLQLGKKLRILVADDAPTNRIILENMLKDAGHEVVCVSDGMRMLQKVENAMGDIESPDHFDIILTDVQMPLMDGITATQKIRELERSNGKNLHIPIIAVTAHAMAEQHTDMRNAGVDGVVTKPIEPNALAEMLERLSGRAQPAAVAAAISTKPVPTTALSEEEMNQMADRLWSAIKERASSETQIVESEMPMLQLKAAEVLDISDLYNRSGQSARRTGMILRAFKDSYQPELDKLVRASNERDLETLKKAAHTLKGLLFDIGSKCPGSVAGSIEAHCWAGRFDEGSELVPALKDQTLMVAQLVETLSAELR